MVRGGGASTRRRPLGALSQPAAGAAGKAPPSRGVGKRGAAGVRKSREAEVRALAAELDAEVEKRCASIRQVANDSIIMLRNEYRRQLMRLPKKVRRGAQLAATATPPRKRRRNSLPRPPARSLCH